jgi:hypothetical protein
MVDVRRDRSQRQRDRAAARIQHCVDLALALDQAHGSLRRVATTWTQQVDGLAAANQTLHDALVYAARERLLMSGTARQVAAGEEAFFRLVDVRNVIREGTALQSAVYHRAYHSFSASLWRFRVAVRVDLGERPVSPELVGRIDWSDRDRCAECSTSASGA